MSTQNPVQIFHYSFIYSNKKNPKQNKEKQT